MILLKLVFYKSMGHKDGKLLYDDLILLVCLHSMRSHNRLAYLCIFIFLDYTQFTFNLNVK